MLIVNADDVGRSQDETNAAVQCFEQRRISRASAMVFMRDSERAAELVKACAMPVGLHLNLSERYTAADVPTAIREQQGRVCRFLRANKYSVVVYNPMRAADFAAVVQAQWQEFRRLFGTDPLHIDGHQHMHLSTNILVQKLLPAEVHVRRSFSFSKGQKSGLNRWYRARVDAVLARRHPLTDHFFSLSHHMTEEGISRVGLLAERQVVELMTHPARIDEKRFLLGEAFGDVLRRANAATPAFGEGDARA